MTSLEIAELTGKQHKNVMQAIRNMEPAWEKVQGLKFQLSSRIYNLPNGGTKEVPCYVLTKTECLYIATKFNDEARAKLVLRWEELEREQALGGQSPCALPSPQKKQCPNWPKKSKNSKRIWSFQIYCLNLQLIIDKDGYEDDGQHDRCVQRAYDGSCCRRHSV
jgi:phage regulator Rha-like protein